MKLSAWSGEIPVVHLTGHYWFPSAPEGPFPLALCQQHKKGTLDVRAVTCGACRVMLDTLFDRSLVRLGRTKAGALIAIPTFCGHPYLEVKKP